MKPSDMFAVVVRAFGLWLVLWSLWSLIGAIANLRGFLAEIQRDEMRASFLFAVAGGIAGLYLLRGAPGLIKFSFPDTSDQEGPTHRSSESPTRADARAGDR